MSPAQAKHSGCHGASCDKLKDNAIILQEYQDEEEKYTGMHVDAVDVLGAIPPMSHYPATPDSPTTLALEGIME